MKTDLTRGSQIKEEARGMSDAPHEGVSGKATEDGPPSLLESALLNAAEAVIITDARLDPPGPAILYVNPAFTRMTGYGAVEIAGQTPRILQGAKTDRAILDRLREALACGESFEGEAVNYRKDGSEYIVSWRIAPVRDERGEVTHFVSVQSDVTERRRIEEALRLAHDDLEWRVGQRTAELTAANALLNDEIAERKRAEESLRVSEQTFRELVDFLPTAVYVCDSLGAIESYNRRAVELWGRAPKLGDITDAFSGAYKIYTPDGDYLPYAESPMARALRTGMPVSDTEIVIERPDGSRRTAIVNILPRRDKQGNLIGAINCLTDITERKRDEDRLKENKRQAALRADVGLALAESGTLHVILQRCAEAIVLHLGAAFARVWTLNEAEGVLELRASAGLYTHTDGAHARIRVGEFKIGLIAQERRPHLTNDVLNDLLVSDREWAVRERMASFAGYPLLVEERLVGVAAIFARETLPIDVIDALGSVSDVIAQGIERKRAEEALREREARLRVLIEQMPAVLWATDMELRFTLSMGAGLAAMKLQPNQVVGMSLYEFFGTDDPEYVPIAAQRRALAGESLTYEIEWLDVTFHTYVEPLRDVEGNIVGGIGVALDITGRKLAEADRARLLTRLVTAEEEERRRIAHELHDQLGRFPTVLMLGLKALSNAGEIPSSAGNRIQELMGLSDQLGREIHRLAWDLRPGALDDLGLHISLSNYLEEWSQNSGITFDFHSNGLMDRRLPPQVETVIYRIAQESLTNILKHAHARRVTVVLEYRNERLLAIFEDDGRGFDVEEVLKSSGAQRRIGLVSMQERARLVDGEMEIESTPGAGATLYVRIPVPSEREEEGDEDG